MTKKVLWYWDQAGENRHDHLRLDLHDVLGQGVHPGPDPAGHRQGILCIRQVLLKRYILSIQNSELRMSTLRITILGITTSSIQTFGKTTFTITTLSNTEHSISTASITRYKYPQYNDWIETLSTAWTLIRVATFSTVMLSVVLLVVATSGSR